MEEVTQKIDETIDIYSMNEREEHKLRLLSEELLSMGNHFLPDADALFIVRKEPHCFALCYRAKGRVSMEEKEELIKLSSKKENEMTKTMKGKAAALADYLFNAPVDMHMGTGRYAVGTFTHYEYEWSMKQLMKNVSKLEWDRLEKSIIANYADDIIVGILGDNIEIVVKMNLMR